MVLQGLETTNSRSWKTKILNQMSEKKGKVNDTYSSSDEDIS